MIGAELGAAAKDVVLRLLERGIVANAAHETVLRILPPFIITRDHVDQFISTLDQVLSEVEQPHETVARI
jgi:acetylornithine/succinyldiaminopimelate/putrescine aminotransferase